MSEILEVIATELLEVVPGVTRIKRVEPKTEKGKTVKAPPMFALTYDGGRLHMSLTGYDLEVARHRFKVQEPHFFDDLCHLLTKPIGTIYYTGWFGYYRQKPLREYWRDVILLVLKDLAPSGETRGRAKHKKQRPMLPLTEALRHIDEDQYKQLMAWLAHEERTFSYVYSGPPWMLDRAKARKLMKKAFKDGK